ncbi:MAG: AAA family ATPase [Bacteroidota bacterium]
MYPHIPTAPDYSNNWESLDALFPWIQAMREVPQNPVFHAEGDVWIHCRMVMEELLALDAWRHLPSPEKGRVFWSTLLHDVAKPRCTVRGMDGSISSPKHALVGGHLSRSILYRGIPDPIPFLERERIAQAVRYHGLPLWFWDKSDSQKAVIQASLQTNLSQLALLAEADVKGRICPDQEAMLEHIEFFGEYARELSCWEHPYQFSSPLARFTYFRGQQAPGYDPFDDSWGEVILMSGLPGAGKDHWIAAHGPDYPVISLDNIREEHGFPPTKQQGHVIRIAKERAKSYLRSKQPFIWNATNLTRLLRQPLIDLFTSYKAKVKIVYIEVPYHTCLMQNLKRENRIPSAVIQKLIHKWQVPAIWEAPEVTWVVQEM